MAIVESFKGRGHDVIWLDSEDAMESVEFQ